MGKHRNRHRFLSESSVSGGDSPSRSRSRSKRRSRSPKRHKTSTKRHSHRKRSDSSSPRRRSRRDRSRSGSSRSRDNRRRHRDRDRPRSGERSNRDRDRENRRDEQDNRGQGENNQPKAGETEEPPIEVEKPCFIPSGILAQFSNTVNGVTLKFTEPPDAAVPTVSWRIYPFKGEEALPALHIHRQSCYLIGKDRNVADIPVDHPTCSGQHAVIQFREVKRTVGDTREVVTEVKPYLMDIESKNGTFLNGEKLEPARYYELLEKDVIKFANSSRDYVIMKGD